ncbi:DUF2778 domain-containing protein [Verminephrobacter aporrectodeae subsp. tuberculatae]|uniref:DUF2778 domain-containing protein n=1 Tax=Verminephrobacter aporrectodeae subsp. tuberculatae TaxID=1110392 RepID=A0ABT3KS00_9BURK|nr:RHS repeat-associated core domain-containing protein [Verminephrobacter aporrectodeae]MCW5321090.1 DUF2778 domain-containing protein [Verminephrobacter aporrectodeae subsp. tuberculatae]MCW8200572.1 DUF2778 domain-containing protein [Verminephrobacter aporrectodeae subsp. tuberculatae]
MNRRIWKEQYRDKTGQLLAPAMRTYFLYAGEGMLAEATQALEINADHSISASHAPVITTQYGPTPDSEFMTETLFIKTRNGQGIEVFAYYHGIHFFAPLQATNKTGNVLWAANYNAFGRAEMTTQKAATGHAWIDSQIRLPGQYEDVETGLHYNFHRYYDPETGRYQQSDLIGLHEGMNPYAYASANPLYYIDPMGLAECTYTVLTGELKCVSKDPGKDGFSGIFTSGNNEVPNCKDNPDCEKISNVGPVPKGCYTWGKDGEKKDRLNRRKLNPAKKSPPEKSGRGSFQTHCCSLIGLEGDPFDKNNSCSKGCVVSYCSVIKDLYKFLDAENVGREGNTLCVE